MKGKTNLAYCQPWNGLPIELSGEMLLAYIYKIGDLFLCVPCRFYKFGNNFPLF